MKRNNVAVALYLVSALIFLIVPINPLILDALLALNIAISLIILFNALFAKEVLELSTFPTILLVTTIFRISLNVAATRLILVTGEPGNVIFRFGEIVAGSSPVMGIIIYTI